MSEKLTASYFFFGIFRNLDFLMGDSSLANAEKNTILYLLQRDDDLNVREV